MNHTSLATVRWLAVSVFACVLAALSATHAKASTGLTVLPATGNDGPITVFYPSSSPSQTLQRDGFTLNMAADGVVVPGNKRLVVFSHGTGSPPWVMSDLAQQMVAAGFIVAAPQHAGDNRNDQSKIGPPSWQLRPFEVSRTIDAIGKDQRFAPLVDLNNVGMWGLSAGGHTALVLAGGRWSAARLRDHCEVNLAADFAACVGGTTTLNGDLLDGPKKFVAMAIIRWQMRDPQLYGHTDPRIKAIVSAVPWAANFDRATLANPPVPLGLVQMGKDAWLAPEFHVGAIAAACKPCEMIVNLPTGGHGALLSPYPPDLPTRYQPLVIDPPGFDRAAELPALQEKTTAFFLKHLNVNP